MARTDTELRIIERRTTSVAHYPIRDGGVVVRWRDSADIDGRGYIVEANIGGVIVEGAGHYGNGLGEAIRDAKRIRARLATPDPEADHDE